MDAQFHWANENNWDNSDNIIKEVETGDATNSIFSDDSLETARS